MSTSRKSKFKTPQTISTMKRIVDSTRFLLARRGSNSFSIRAIADRAGVSVGTIYKHYPSKDALVDYVVADALKEFELRLLRAITPIPVGSFERIAALGTAYIQLALDYEEHFKVLFTPMKPKPRKLSELPGRGGFDVLRQCVVEAIESGCIRNADPDLIAFFLWSRVHGIVTLLWVCDFQGVLPFTAEQLTASSLFEATREFIAEGLGVEDGT
jgi:AcrR family transcriptional regulator